MIWYWNKSYAQQFRQQVVECELMYWNIGVNKYILLCLALLQIAGRTCYVNWQASELEPTDNPKCVPLRLILMFDSRSYHPVLIETNHRVDFSISNLENICFQLCQYHCNFCDCWPNWKLIRHEWTEPIEEKLDFKKKKSF